MSSSNSSYEALLLRRPLILPLSGWVSQHAMWPPWYPDDYLELCWISKQWNAACSSLMIPRKVWRACTSMHFLILTLHGSTGAVGPRSWHDMRCLWRSARNLLWMMKLFHYRQSMIGLGDMLKFSNRPSSAHQSKIVHELFPGTNLESKWQMHTSNTV